MAEEKRKGPPKRRPGTRSAKSAQAGEKSTTSPGGTPDVNATEQTRGQDPDDAARFDAEQLDASIREREREDRGEVF